MNPKLERILQSRKVWATVMGLAATAALYGMDEINGTQANDSLVWITGIFIGAVALEDGLSNLIKVWLVDETADATKTIGPAAPTDRDPGDLLFSKPYKAKDYERNFRPQ